MGNDLTKLEKISASSPWLVRYPLWRANERIRRMVETTRESHLILTVANHFEPAWDGTREGLGWAAQLSRVDDWHKMARRIGAVRDHDGRPFQHTNFYPGEQYHRGILDRLAEMQDEGLGEVEVHLHHGVDAPDTPENLRRSLEEFRDVLAEDHKLLSRGDDGGKPMYGFVHGNSALANSAGGACCGVDSEMRILAETGCYGDFTLSSVHSRAQTARFNAIYSCGRPLDERAPHRSGANLRAGSSPTLPIIFTGPTVFDWSHRKQRRWMPRIDDGVLTAVYPLDFARLRNWRSARVGIRGRPEWIFIKLYCHGFFRFDPEATIGDTMRRFLEDALDRADRTGDFKLHFASARETFNIAMAAIEGKEGNPNDYRDYKLKPIMRGSRRGSASPRPLGRAVEAEAVG